MDNQNQSLDLQNSQPNIFLKIKTIIIQNKFMVIIIAVLGMISFGSTGYLLMANDTQTAKAIIIAPTSPPVIELSQTVLEPTHIPNEIPIPTIISNNQASTLSAYLSKKYFYSLKYPSDWITEITTQDDPKILEYVVFNPKTATEAGTLSITLSYGTRSYSEALALDPQIGEIISVSSISATKKNNKDSNGIESINVIIPTGLKTIILYAQKQYEDVLNQILSTLFL